MGVRLKSELSKIKLAYLKKEFFWKEPRGDQFVVNSQERNALPQILSVCLNNFGQSTYAFPRVLSLPERMLLFLSHLKKTANRYFAHCQPFKQSSYIIVLNPAISDIHRHNFLHLDITGQGSPQDIHHSTHTQVGNNSLGDRKKD